jgi:undecaprenyl diphosphate synthase
MTLHIALDYGGQDEVVRAVRKLASPAEATVETIRAGLDQPALPDIDLIIRTSGEQRTSNFFLWQSTYAEWLFAPEYFPDFGPEKLKTALDAFGQRQRRFGR